MVELVPIAKAIDLKTPTAWDLLQATVKRLVRRIEGIPTDARRDVIILDAAVALRGGHCHQAADILAPFRGVLGSDPAYLNLMGIVCELQHELKYASRFYGLAMCVDPTYQPARQNMQRLYELSTFGRTYRAVSLGDVELRTCRRVPAPGPARVND